jgi:hypothetical protein
MDDLRISLNALIKILNRAFPREIILIETSKGRPGDAIYISNGREMTGNYYMIVYDMKDMTANRIPPNLIPLFNKVEKLATNKIYSIKLKEEKNEQKV